MIAATVTATAVARYIDGYSIYTARLRARPGGPDAQPGGAPAGGAPAGGTGPAVVAPEQGRQVS
jgi:hypothetical protein